MLKSKQVLINSFLSFRPPVATVFSKNQAGKNTPGAAPRKHSYIAHVVIAAAALGLGGCGSTFTQSKNALANWELEPWVKPFERSNLADPIMSAGRNPVSLAYENHVLESREGARGASGGAGGGCGCN